MDERQTPAITPDEFKIIVAYRAADSLTKQMIVRLLGMEGSERQSRFRVITGGRQEGKQ